MAAATLLSAGRSSQAGTREILAVGSAVSAGRPSLNQYPSTATPKFLISSSLTSVAAPSPLASCRLAQRTPGSSPAVAAQRPLQTCLWKGAIKRRCLAVCIKRLTASPPACFCSRGCSAACGPERQQTASHIQLGLHRWLLPVYTPIVHHALPVLQGLVGWP